MKNNNTPPVSRHQTTERKGSGMGCFPHTKGGIQ